WDMVLLLGYEFVTHLEGWRRFCAEIPVAPDLLWEKLPGFETLKRVEGLAIGNPEEDMPGIAFVAEGVARYRAHLAKGGSDAEVDGEDLEPFWPTTAEAIAVSLRIVWEEQMKKWD